MGKFDGKVALVTGAASGIGRATAISFAREGANVVVADMKKDGGLQTVAMIEKMNKKSIFVHCDVSKASEVQNMLDITVKTFGKLDYAFNNAGIEGLQGSTADTTEENYDRVMDINVKGTWLCMKYEIPLILKQGGAIVNCSSIAGVIGFPGIPAYTASKHAVLGLTKTAALEYAKTNLRINAVCPGVIMTPMIERFTHGEAQALKQLSAGEPVGRIGKPEEIAEAVLFLCSEGASFITGHPLIVDGGWVVQ